MNPIITNNLSELARLCEKYHIKVMYIFGSASTDAMREDSDVDLLISFMENVSFEDYADYYFGLLDDLRKLLGKKIDLVTERSISNPYFQKEVDLTKRLIYAA